MPVHPATIPYQWVFFLSLLSGGNFSPPIDEPSKFPFIWPLYPPGFMRIHQAMFFFPLSFFPSFFLLPWQQSSQSLSNFGFQSRTEILHNILRYTGKKRYMWKIRKAPRPKKKYRVINSCLPFGCTVRRSLFARRVFLRCISCTNTSYETTWKRTCNSRHNSTTHPWSYSSSAGAESPRTRTLCGYF